MEFLRFLFPLLILYTLLVFISSPSLNRLAYLSERDARTEATKTTSSNNSVQPTSMFTTTSAFSLSPTVDNNSPPYFDIIYQSIGYFRSTESTISPSLNRLTNSTGYSQNVSLSPTVDTNSPPYFDIIYQSEQICEGSNPYILILVTSGLQNRQRRDIIRKTWGAIARGKQWPRVGHVKGIRLVFLLGEGHNASLNSELEKEARQNNDMMIGRFNDTYRNLSNKVLMGFKWMKLFCPGAKYVMKTDDDSFLDIPKIIDRVKGINSNNTIIGSVAEREKPDRDKTSRYYVSETEYPGTEYPPHVKGCMYVIPRDLALNILNASQRFNFLSMEDVFITGVLAEPFHVKHSGIPDELYDKNVGDGSKIDVCSFILRKKLMAHNVDSATALRLWKRMTKSSNICFYVVGSDGKLILS